MSSADKNHIQEAGSGLQSASARQVESVAPEVVEAVPPSFRGRVPLDDHFDWSALATLFTLTLRQHLRGKRLLVLCFLFVLPSLVVILTRTLNPTKVRASELEFGSVFMLLPHALLPLAALLYASGMIQDELEEQTLTYLLVRPLPRWALYVAKLLATWLLTSALSSVFAALTLIVVHWGEANLWGEILPLRAFQLAVVLTLTQLPYCSLFGLISLYTRWAMVVGIFYILVFEGILANLEFAVRRLTAMFYFRVLATHWLDVTDRYDTWAFQGEVLPAAG